MKRVVFVLIWIALATACSADRPLNPSFPVTVAEARDILEQLEDEPKPLARPLLILGGINDPGFAPGSMKRRLAALFEDDAPITAISFFSPFTFEKCRDKVISVVREQYGYDEEDSDQLVEVDVVAFSMGGLIARYAALPRFDDDSVLRINRLFTISTPHRGASLANWPTIDPRVKDMRAGSAFLAVLDRALSSAEYELVPYVRLGDVIVGEENAAPIGRGVWWVQNQSLRAAHLWAGHDPRLTADIARRLRDEEPLTKQPQSPFPHAQNR